MKAESAHLQEETEILIAKHANKWSQSITGSREDTQQKRRRSNVSASIGK